MHDRADSSLLEQKYDGLNDALSRVNLARRFSVAAGVVFLAAVAAGGWHLYDSWFARSRTVGRVGVGSLILYGLVLVILLPQQLGPVVAKFNAEIAINRRSAQPKMISTGFSTLSTRPSTPCFAIFSWDMATLITLL